MGLLTMGNVARAKGVEDVAGEALEQPQILVVDDENGPRQALRMLLKEDYVVHMATNVDEALCVLREQPIALVISDVRMPRRSGVDLLRDAKQLVPEVQVILLTGYGQLETAVKAVEYGAFTYIEKPFDNEAMLSMVEAGLEKYREEKHRRALEYLALEANRFETLGRVVSGMMHDLGSPLTVLGSQLELLAAQPDRPDIAHRISTMQAQIQHCNDMVRSTMNFLRNESHNYTKLRLNAVIDSCIDVGRVFMREARVDVRLDLADDLPTIEGDMVLLRQAILNIMTNGCHAMKNQTCEKELLFRTWTSEGKVHLSIEDTGPGIAKEVRGRIFDTFFTTKGSEGTGLGLSVVRNAMRRHRGTVVLAPGNGRGACFVLSFPIAL